MPTYRQAVANHAVELLKQSLMDLFETRHTSTVGPVCRELGLLSDSDEGAFYRHTTDMVNGALNLLLLEGKIKKSANTWEKA